MPGFQDLTVWRQAKELAVEIYKVTRQPLLSRDYGMTDQVRRAAVSIPSNIAEGDERGTNKDGVRFLFITKGSLAELQTQLLIAHEMGYLDKSVFQSLQEKCCVLGRMLGSLISARQRAGEK